MRHRETTLDSRTVVQRRAISRAYNTSCNASWTNGTPTNILVGEYYHKFIDDCEIPAFRRVQRRGDFLPLNPVTICTTVETRNPGKVPHDVRRNGCLIGYYDPDWAWTFFDGEVVVPTVDPNLTQVAVNSSVADLKSATWDALTSLAEVRKSVDLIGSLMRQILSTAASVARASYASAARPPRKGRRARSQSDVWSEARQGFNRRWLEARFGIRPLLKEIDDAIASIHRADDALLRGKARVVQDLSETKNRVENVSEYQRRTITTVLSGERYYRGSAFGRVDNSLQLRSGLSPIVTGYELIPFSFVLDWFWDIGTYLQALDPFSGARMVGNCASVRTSYTVTQTVFTEFFGKASSEPSGTVHSGSGTYSTVITYDRYDRFSHDVSVPGLNIRLNPAKLLDLLTIITSGRALVARNLRGD